MQERTQIKDRAEALISWYRRSARELPWRKTRDPYAIWISEVMLQQTRAVTVIPYWERFLKEAPTVKSLAELPDDRLMKLWEGLGYYNRARNLKKCARFLMEKYDGKLPNDYEKLRELPGFGPYIAAAVGAFAFSLPVVPADGNVFRVFCRFYGISDDLRSETTKRKIRALAVENTAEPAGDYGQALIELGATVCIPGTPSCDLCPLAPGCTAKALGSQADLPFISRARPRRIERRCVVVVSCGGKMLLRKRPNKGLLAGLYELPSYLGEGSEKKTLLFVKKMGFEALRIRSLPFAKHIFSHLEWHMDAYRVDVAETALPVGCEGILVTPDELGRTYALPSAFSAWLDELRSVSD